MNQGGGRIYRKSSAEKKNNLKVQCWKSDIKLGTESYREMYWAKWSKSADCHGYGGLRQQALLFNVKCKVLK